MPFFVKKKVLDTLEAKVQSSEAESVQLRGVIHTLGGIEAVDASARLVELNKLVAKLDEDRRQLEKEADDIQSEILKLRSQAIDVRHDVSVQKVSLYDFEHPAEASEKYADELTKLRAKIKAMVARKSAAEVSENFTFNGSSAKGRTFSNRMMRTMLSAYHAEVENAIKTMRAGGLEVAKTRLNRVVERIEKNGQMIDLRINPAYHKLRIRELEIADMHLAAVKAEKELERERRAELREQQKAEAELRRERERLAKERSHYANVLEALRQRGDQSEVEKIEAQLAEVDRAIDDVDYRAANIRAGYVYVISNIGSMGEQMVKIGMTRRLEPMDRVRELGDASVPFPFDVHALFFADDAVSIEAMLHREFAKQRVNRINTRREFFYCTPADVLEKLREHGVSVLEYRLEVDAEQFRMSEAARS